MELPACALAFVIFSVWFPAIGGNIVTLSPSPEAKVTEGDNLKLQCIYSGSFTPDTVNWYLNNDTLGFVLLASDCSEASVPPLYGSGRYNKTCSIPSFSLLIQNVTIIMDGDIWSCDTTSLGNPPPSKVSTRIKVQRTTTIPSSTAATVTSVDFITRSAIIPTDNIGNSSVLPTSVYVVAAGTLTSTDNISFLNAVTSSSIMLTVSNSASVTSMDVVTLGTMTPTYDTGYSNVSVTLLFMGTPINAAPIYNSDTVSQSSGTTTTTTTTVTSSSLSSTSSNVTTDKTSAKPTTGPSISATSSTSSSNLTNDKTSEKPTTTGSAPIATNSTSTSMSPTVVSPANNVSNASISAKPTTTGPTATTKTSTGNNGTKGNISDTDIKVIVPAVVVPCGLLIIGAIVFVIFCVRRKARKNVRESPDGMAIQDKGNNIDGWKQSFGHGKATDNLDTVYTTPDGFIIYPGPAAESTTKLFKDKKYHGVTDQYSRPNPGTRHHQADYIPSTYTSARAYTHRDKKHHVVTDQYSRPYPDTYGNQTAYFSSTYKSARTYAQMGKTYEGHQPVYNPMANSRLAYDQPASNLMATSRLAYDQTAYYPQTGYYGQSGQDVYYSGGGQHSYGQRLRSHHDHNDRRQQRDYYSQYEMADYRGNRAGYRHTKQDTAFYY